MQEMGRQISPIKDRILQYIEYLGISKYKFYKKSGITRGVLDKTSGICEENIAKFVVAYPGVSLDWLMLGNGPIEKSKSNYILNVSDHIENAKENGMIQNIHKSLALVEDPGLNKYSQDSGKLYIPYLPSQTFSFIQSEPDLSQFETYRIPGLRNADFLMPYYCDDMQPTVSAGNIIAGKIVKKAPLYTWGRVHLFELEEVGVVMGRLRPASQGDSVRCEPENPSFQAIEFPIENIIAIAMLMAVIKIL